MMDRDPPSIELLHDDGSPSIQEWHNENGRLDRDTLPARIQYAQDGSWTREEYVLDGEFQHLVYREYVPGTEQLLSESYLDINAEGLGDPYPGTTLHVTHSNHLHREDGPASVTYTSDGRVKNEAWFIHGSGHRDDGLPAVISRDDNGDLIEERWFVNGQRHRDNGPSHIAYNFNGTPQFLEWRKNGDLHREDGPAIQVLNDHGDVLKAVWALKGIKYITIDESRIIEPTRILDANQRFIAMRDAAQSGFTNDMAKAWAGLE